MSSKSDAVLLKQVKCHSDIITSIKVPKLLRNLQQLVTSSRDKTLCVVSSDKDSDLGKVYKRQGKHGHFIQNFSLSNDGCFAFTACWDGLVRTIKLRAVEPAQRDKHMNLVSEIRPKVFKAHTSDVLDVTICPTEQHILSVGRDNNIIYWNIYGELKFKLDTEHSDWITSVKFFPMADDKVLYFLTTSWDGSAKRINLYKPEEHMVVLRDSIGALDCSAISPDGTYIALGSKEGHLSLWHMKNQNSEVAKVFDLDLGAPVRSLEFHNEYFFLFAATDDGLKFINLKSQIVEKTIQIKAQDKEKELKNKACYSMALNAKGNQIYSGWNDGFLRIYEFEYRE